MKDFNLQRGGIPHLLVRGKGGKTRYVPMHAGTLGLITDYLVKAGHGEDSEGALLRPVKSNRGGSLEAALTANGLYASVVCKFLGDIGINQELFGSHALRVTAATNALLHNAEIAKVQEWLGHMNIQTTRLYDKRAMRPKDSPTFVVRY